MEAVPNSAVTSRSWVQVRTAAKGFQIVFREILGLGDKEAQEVRAGQSAAPLVLRFQLAAIPQSAAQRP